MTKLAPHRVHQVRTRGGNMKYRALRLDQGNFSWATEACARKVRIIDVVYNASNNELVRTKTLVKGAIVTIDSTPFRQWYEAHSQGPGPQEERQADRGGAEDDQWPTLGQLPEEDRRATQGGRGRRFSRRAIRPGSPLGSHCFPTRSNRPLRRVHLGGQGARLLRPQVEGQEDEINSLSLILIF